MQVEIDPASPTPIYQQLRDRLVEAIAGGALVPGQALASVRQLAVAFGINVATVSKGYDLLRQEGLIRTNRKSGSVVARGPRSGAPPDGFRPEWRARLTTVLAEAVAQGLTTEEILAVTAEVLAAFGPEAPGPEAPGPAAGGK